MRTLDFEFSIELGGSESFAIQPLGGDTAVAMRADWPHPSFQGQFLPLRHEIGPQGFSAHWKMSRYAVQDKEQLLVSFVEPAGLYQQLERASKYGFLFIGLTFAAFLLFELLRRLAIHPVQYALVGLALAMFFLLLTALSEHIAFAAAYAAATLACVGLVTGYLVRVLKSARIGLAFGGALAALYAMLYALLKAEDYSLLGGALLLFGLLAAVMVATRRVDWYALSARPQAGQTAPIVRKDQAGRTQAGAAACPILTTRIRRSLMLSWAITFFVLALVAAIFGFTGIAAGAAGIAKMLLLLFVIGFMVSLIVHPAAAGAARPAGLEKQKARFPGLFLALRGVSRAARRLHGLDIGRGRTLLAGAHFEGDLLAFLQRLVAVHLDRAVMGEQVLAAVIGRDEAEALGVVEPLHGAVRHVISILEIAAFTRGYPSPAAGTKIKGGIDCH